MPDGMTLATPPGMLPVEKREFDNLLEVMADMLSEAGAICNESLHRQDVGNSIAEVARNVRSAQNRAWFPDQDFVEPEALDATATFEDAAYDPDVELEEPEIAHDTLEAN